ncbi:MAG: hypothetical protein IKR71_09320 [Bacteroidales bacterium]|nr:hypothetical protein [Bacteroidales bacterium]
MKNLLTPLFFACLLFAGSLFAQQHLAFKGVPIDGTLQAYTNAMVKAGFHYEGTQDGIAILSGDFAGYKNCLVGVSTLKNCDVVSHIAVLFPEKETWSALRGDYENLKTMLTEKYGIPSESRERFTDKYISETSSNIAIIHALHEDQCEWFSTFTTELGDIQLSIMPGSKKYDTGMVRLSYYDKANSEKVRSSAIDDL